MLYLIIAFLALPYTLVSLFIPGYLIVNHYYKTANPLEKLSLSFLPSILIYCLATLLLWIFNIPYYYSFFIQFPLILASLFLFIRNKYFNELKSLRILLIYYFLGLIFVILFVNLTVKFPLSAKYPPNSQGMYSKAVLLAGDIAGDNYLPYRTIQFIQNKFDLRTHDYAGYWNLTDRTQGAALVINHLMSSLFIKTPIAQLWDMSPVEQSLDFSYYFFEVMSIVLNSLFVFPLLLLVKTYFYKNKLEGYLIFLFLNPFVIIHLLYTWPKFIVGYFLFLAYFYIIKRKMLYFGSFIAGLSYLFHQMSLVYFAGILIVVFLKQLPTIKEAILKSSISLLIYGLVLSPWVFWVNFIIQSPSKLITDNLYGLDTTALYIVNTRIINLFRNLTPYYLTSNSILNWTDFKSSIDLMYIFTFPGALLFSIYPITIYAIIKYWKQYKNLLITFCVVPLILFILIINKPHPGNTLHSFQLSIVILLVLTYHSLLRFKNRLFYYFFGLLYFCEALIVFWLLRYQASWFTSNDVSQAIVLIIIQTIFLSGIINRTYLFGKTKEISI